MFFKWKHFRCVSNLYQNISWSIILLQVMDDLYLCCYLFIIASTPVTLEESTEYGMESLAYYCTYKF